MDGSQLLEHKLIYFPIFSSCFPLVFLGVSLELHVKSRERDGWPGGKLDLVWTFMLCIDDSVWFLKALCCLSRFPFLCFSDLLAEFWRWFLARFSLGVTYGDFVPLWMVTLPEELPWIDLDLLVFWVAQVHDLKGQNRRFPLIVGVSVRFLWGRGCPGGNPAILEVSPQSVGWIGRSSDGKLRVDLRPVFWVGRSNGHRGRSNRPRSPRWNFWFCQIFLYEFVRFDQRSVQVISSFVLV
jgi:hypothetical protein